MNLQRVGGRPDIVLSCVHEHHDTNGRWLRADRRDFSDVVFADLDGEPFKAFYCTHCVRKLIRQGVEVSETVRQAAARGV